MRVQYVSTKMIIHQNDRSAPFWVFPKTKTKMIAKMIVHQNDRFPKFSSILRETTVFKRKMKKSLKINEIWANLHATTFEISLKIVKIVQILILRKYGNHKNQQFLNIFEDYSLQNLPVFGWFSLILLKSLFWWVFSMFFTKISFPKTEVKMIAKMIIHQNDRFSNSLTKKL